MRRFCRLPNQIHIWCLQNEVLLGREGLACVKKVHGDFAEFVCLLGSQRAIINKVLHGARHVVLTLFCFGRGGDDGGLKTW